MTLTTPAGTPASCIDLGQRIGGERGLGGGLQDDGAAGGERGAILRVAIAAGKFQGVISTADADRLVIDQDAVGCRQGAMPNSPRAHGLLGIPAEEFGGIGDFAARVGQRLAVFQGDQVASIPRPSIISSKHRRRISARWRGGGLAPAGGGLVGGIDRGHGIGEGRIGDCRQESSSVEGSKTRMPLAGASHLPPMNRPVGIVGAMRRGRCRVWRRWR